MLEVTNIKKSYKYGRNKEEEVLKGLSVTFEENKINIILGPSGCGKSTLLNLISGLDTNYTGDILFSGKNLRTLNLDSYRNQAIGFVFQNFNLIAHLSVLENVKVSLNLNKKSERANNATALEKLKMVGMESFSKKKPNELSGGQKQRVAIARALANNPEIIIADEPTGALDTKTSHEVKQILKDLVEQYGKTVIIVTHDTSFIDLADRTIRMEDGSVVDVIDTPKSITEIADEDKTELNLFRNRYGMFKTLKNAFKNINTRKLRTGLVSFATAIGIAGILVSLSLGTGVNSSVENLFSTVINPNAVNFSSKNPEGGQPTDFMTSTAVETAKKAMEEKGITEFEENSYTPMTIVEVKDKLVNDKKSGKIETAGDFPGVFVVQQMMKGNEGKYTAQNLEAGSSFGEGEAGVYIQADAAKQLLGITEPLTSDYETLIGDEITINFSKVINDELKSAEVKVPIKGVLKPSGFANLSILDYQSYDSIMAELGIENYVIVLAGIAENADKADIIAKELRRDDKLNEEFAISTQKDVIGAFTQVFSIITIILAAVAGLALVVSGFMILIILFTSVVERTREIGTMRALGFKRGHIRNIFISEAIIMVLIANGIAYAMITILQFFINQITQKMFQFDAIIITIPNVLIVFSITMSVAIIAAILPAIRASRLDPSEALRYE